MVAGEGVAPGTSYGGCPFMARVLARHGSLPPSLFPEGIKSVEALAAQVHGGSVPLAALVPTQTPCPTPPVACISLGATGGAGGGGGDDFKPRELRKLQSKRAEPPTPPRNAPRAGAGTRGGGAKHSIKVSASASMVRPPQRGARGARAWPGAKRKRTLKGPRLRCVATLPRDVAARAAPPTPFQSSPKGMYGFVTRGERKHGAAGVRTAHCGGQRCPLFDSRRDAPAERGGAAGTGLAAPQRDQ